VEATLPSWEELLRRLLRRAAQASLPSLRTEKRRDAWIDETLRKDSYLGAGAIVEALSGEQLQTWLPQELFGSDGPGAFEPGQVSRQIAYLRNCFGDALTILTVNYDDLIERGLQQSGIPLSQIKSYVRRRQPSKGAVPVTHLHGFAGRDVTKSPLVLSEEHYHRMQRGQSWQEKLVVERLNESVCLFVGTSLTDPNLIRYLYGHERKASRKHAALFIRQEDSLRPDVRRARETATRARWTRCGVTPIFLDHYCDAAQLLYEIGHRRDDPGTYEPVQERAKAWLHRARRDLLMTARDNKFGSRQQELSDRLRQLLDSAVALAESGSKRPSNERLQLVLWLSDASGEKLTGWAHSDRAHLDRRTVAPVPITADSNWVAVRAFCQGSRFERDRDVYASRWKFIRGLPLIIDDPARLPVGCISVASNLPARKSILRRMPSDLRSAFNELLVKGVLDLLGKA
jgi:hypothetical protein